LKKKYNIFDFQFELSRQEMSFVDRIFKRVHGDDSACTQDDESARTQGDDSARTQGDAKRRRIEYDSARTQDDDDSVTVINNPRYDLTDEEIIEIVSGNSLDNILDAFFHIASYPERCVPFIQLMVEKSFNLNRLDVATLFFLKTSKQYPRYFLFFREFVMRACTYEGVIKNVFGENRFDFTDFFLEEHLLPSISRAYTLTLAIAKLEFKIRNRNDQAAYPHDERDRAAKHTLDCGYGDIDLDWDTEKCIFLMRTDRPRQNRIFNEYVTGVSGVDVTLKSHTDELWTEFRRLGIMQDAGIDVNSLLGFCKPYFLAELGFISEAITMLNMRPLVLSKMQLHTLFLIFRRLYETGRQGQARFFIPVALYELTVFIQEILTKYIRFSVHSMDFGLTMYILSKIPVSHRETFIVCVETTLIEYLSTKYFGRKGFVAKPNEEAYISALALRPYMRFSDRMKVLTRMIRLGNSRYVAALLKSPQFTTSDLRALLNKRLERTAAHMPVSLIPRSVLVTAVISGLERS
jgi:hypothetical protein